MFKLELPDKYHLMALHRALMESKFCANPHDKLVQLSPMISNTMNSLVDILETINWATDAERKFRGIEWKNDWEEWRQNPPEEFLIEHFQRHLHDNKYYLEATRGKRLEYLQILAAPYLPSDEQLFRLAYMAVESDSE